MASHSVYRAILHAFLMTLIFSGQPEMACAQQPNIVFINLDDADRDTFHQRNLDLRFPAVGEIAARGMTFTQCYVSSPKCGPSRACLMRGQYAHSINHRTNEVSAKVNRGFQGGFSSFDEQGFFDDDFGKWMKDGGYETVFVGKYMNGIYDTRVPKGWDHFYLARGSEYYRTFRFTNRDKDNPQTEVLPPNVYRTDAEVDDIVNVIENELAAQKPFLIYFAPFGPHTEGKAEGGMVANELANAWPNLKPIRQADYNEKNNDDKPLAYRQLPPLTIEDEIEFQQRNRQRMLAVKSVDNGVARIVNALKAKGLYQNTYFFITSDNGFSLGQHRFKGKGKTLSRSSHVPLIVSGPDILGGSVRNTLTSQIDFAPTFLDLAGIVEKPFFDGKSLAPVLFSRSPEQAEGFRDSLLVENWETTTAKPFVLNTTFTQLRTPTESFTEWADGTREYYQLDLDPLELRNRASQLTAEQLIDFEQRIDQLRRPMPAPITTFYQPETDWQEFTGPPFQLAGMAEDSGRIKRVDLVIRNAETGEFWNGVQWQETRSAQRAVLMNQGGVQTEWNYVFDPPKPVNLEESYVVTARAISTQKSFSREVETRGFKYDSLLPVTMLKNPRVMTNGQVIFSGVSTDNLELKYTELVIQDLNSKKFFDGKNWQNTRQTVKVDPTESGEWEWTSAAFPESDFVVRARAYDEAGNYDSKPVARRFSVGN